MKRQKPSPTAKDRRERKQALGPAQEIVEVLNYRAGQESLADKCQAWEEEMLADIEATPEEAADASLLDEMVVGFDPTADRPMDEERMLACQGPLREFVDSWREAGYDIERWRLRAEVEAALNKRYIVFFKGMRGRPEYYLETPTVRPPRGYDPEGYTAAIKRMFDLITSPWFRDIGRCPRCKAYHLATRGTGRKRFCSQRCANADWATTSTSKRRARERAEKLRCISRADEAFGKLSPTSRLRKEGWISYVLREANKLLYASESQLLVTPNFITRALNKGELKPPASR